MNPDTLSGELRQTLEKHGPLDPEVPTWPAVEAPLPEAPALAPDFIPEVAAVRAGLTAPELPLVLPAIGRMLDQVASVALEPWDI
jgi:hypothetical protein